MKTLWTRLVGGRWPGRQLARSAERGLAGDKRGAVYVEFLAVFFPIFTFFMALVQFAFLQTASIIVQHAAMKATRVASVVLYGNPAEFGGTGQGVVGGDREQMIREAGRYPLVPLGSAALAKVDTNKKSYGSEDDVTVTVEYDYVCKVPLGRLIVCGAGSKKTLKGTATLPVQGAEFIY